MTRTAFCRKSPRVPRVCWLGSWALGTSDRGGVCVRGLHMTLGLDEPRGLAWQCADWASSYSVPGSAMAASAFAMIASARFIAALSSSLFQASTEWPSSNDRSLASRERESNSRSAATASESSLASAPFREDCTSLSPSHRNYGPSTSIVTKDDYCNCPRSHVRGLLPC